MALLKQFGITGAFAILIYLFLFGVMRTLLPVPEVVDTEHSVNLLYEDEARTAIYARRALKAGEKNLIILGSSNVREGFRPEELAPAFPEYTVHQFSVHASNIRYNLDVLNLIYETLPEKHEPIIFVLGSSYLSYGYEALVDGGGYNHSLIETEMLRFGIYRENIAGVIHPIVPSSAVLLLIDAIHPFMAFYKVERKVTRTLDFGAQEVIKVLSKISQKRKSSMSAVAVDLEKVKDLAANRPAEGGDVLEKTVPKKKNRFQLLKEASWRERTDMLMAWVNGQKYDRDEREVTVEDKAMMLKKRNNAKAEDYFGDDHQQFQFLRELAKKIKFNNDQLVIVDVPLPLWHSQGSFFNGEYVKLRKKYYSELEQILGVHYLNIEDLNSEKYFYDSCHPKPKYTHLWAKRFIEEMSLRGLR